jgi:hypothetical protein
MNENQAVDLWVWAILVSLASACFGGDVVITLIMARAGNMTGTSIFATIGIICFISIIYGLKKILKHLKEMK